MRRSFSSGLLAVFLCGAVLMAGCPVEHRTAMQRQAVDPACADACAELHDDCVGAQAASTFLLIPAYLIAIAGALVLIGGGGGSGNCGNGGFGAGVSCRDARSECLSGCPLAARSYPQPQPQPGYAR